MSQNPFLDREVKKYKSLIPSREYILSYLQKRKKPLSCKILSKELNLINKKQIRALSRRLHAMEYDGQLIFTSHQYYILPERLNLLRGIVIGHRDGYGFLRVNSRKDDLYLSIDQMKTVIHGDLVLAKVINIDRKGRCEAHIIKVLEQKKNEIIGRFFMNANIGFVIPDDSRFSFNILIPSSFISGANVGDMVVTELTQRPTRHTKGVGKIIEILGNQIDMNMAINIALHTHNIPHVWLPKLEKYIIHSNNQILKNEKKDRINLCKLPFVTIDDEDALDFDDAVYCEKKSCGSWHLWVAIADVSYYVRPNTDLDNEARNRATSVYFPSQVIPMLPKFLSNNLCSLKPYVDRLCMVCEMIISDKGRLLTSKFYEATMRSHARLTYDTVCSILHGDKLIRDHHYFLVQHLEKLYELYQLLHQARINRGGIVFEVKKAKFILSIDHHINCIQTIVRNDAHKIIEECMIMANISAAKFVEKYNEPALFRIHDRPSDDHVLTLRSVLNELGLTLGGGDKPNSKDYAVLMNKISLRKDCEMLQSMLIRSMKQAIYDPKNRGHFGLGLLSYGHFTSPIRRYPDLTLHRSIKYQLAKFHGLSKKYYTSTGGWHSQFEDVLKLGIHCSHAERRADEAIRDVTDWLKCDYIKNYVGVIFNGIIVNVTSFGLFVRLNDLFIDGLVHMSTLDNDYYRYDSIAQRLIGKSSGIIYRLGDSVIIRVEEVHLEDRKINFTLVSNSLNSLIKKR
ncbi:Ribonuclease R [Candidatus Ecksteinia adelgidicola]|nr:Ribonuclease R [Candidatus Ecksteinia adelgidicola]